VKKQDLGLDNPDRGHQVKGREDGGVSMSEQSMASALARPTPTSYPVNMAPSPEASVVVQQAPRAGAPEALIVIRPRLRLALAFVGHLAPIPAAALIYESLRGLFHYRGTVHVGDLHAYEAKLFSVATAEGPRAISDVVSRHTSPWLDALCGVTYFFFVAEVLAVATYLFFRSRPRALELSIGFLVVNLIGWGVWFVYPAAPPWYVDQYGTGPALLDVVSSPAGLARVDAWLGLPIATSFYAKSANVFGAIPSLHMAYAMLVAWVAAPLGGWVRVGTIGFAISMAFSAVYLRHHYILDVVAGAALALLVGLIVRAVHRPGTDTSGERS
jgi:inositol phosphorylceramide synthase catalytic subunit